MDLLRNWLNGKMDYVEGVQLYERYGGDPLLKKLFKEGVTDFKVEALKNAINQIVEDSPPVKNVEPKPETDQTIQPGIQEDIQESIEDLQSDLSFIESDLSKLTEKVEQISKAPPVSKGWPAMMDDVVQDLHDKWHPLYTERKSLQARIADVALAGENSPGKKEEARMMALRILELRRDIRKIYKTRDEYMATGCIQNEKSGTIKISDDYRMWPQEFANCQRYVRDYKGKLAKNPNNTKHQIKLENYQAAVNELKQRLGYNAIRC